MPDKIIELMGTQSRPFFIIGRRREIALTLPLPPPCGGVAEHSDAVGGGIKTRISALDPPHRLTLFADSPARGGVGVFFRILLKL
jgi:hypothetical protein